MAEWVLRTAPAYFAKWGVPFKEVDNALDGQVNGGEGWKTRSRSSGDFTDGKPRGIVIHHTASPISQSIGSALRYEIHTADAEPIGNMTIGRDGIVYLTCAGASNTNGSGGPWLTSNEVVPMDTGNSRLIGVEAMNDGIGERWTDAMIDTYPKCIAALCDLINHECGWPNPMLSAGKDVMAHFEYGNVQVPNRKNDPFGPSPWNNFENRRWDMDLFRGTVFNLLTTPTEEHALPVSEEQYNTTIKLITDRLAGISDRNEAQGTRISNLDARLESHNMRISNVSGNLAKLSTAFESFRNRVLEWVGKF